MPRMLKTAETISVRMAVSSIILQNAKNTPAGPIMPRSAPFRTALLAVDRELGVTRFALRGKNPAGPVARAGRMTQRLNWVRNGHSPEGEYMAHADR